MFFTREKSFYKRLMVLFTTIAIQNFLAYSVNMADNVMLGSFRQDVLSGATTVNQIFFMIQMLGSALGETMVMIGSQYWGKKQLSPIRRISGLGLKVTAVSAVIVFALCAVIPRQMIMLFTKDAAIIEQGMIYLRILKYSFVLFLISQCLMAALRTVETVKISSVISLVSLIVNVGLNWILIFGHFGAPRLGITGAAIGTLIARAVELIILIVYVLKIDNKLHLFSENIFRKDKELSADFRRQLIPMVLTDMLWAVSVPMQTAILGHLSSDAIAANSVASTFYNYLKVLIRAMVSASAVLMGSAIGRGDMEEVKREARTLAVADVILGAILGILLFVLRTPLLGFYNLTPEAIRLADQMIILMSVVMVFMSYQMPVQGGIIRASGDTKFNMYNNLLSVWCVVIPLSLLSAFVWHWPVIWVVLMVQSDQIFKCVPVFIRFRGYKWIRKLTRD